MVVDEGDRIGKKPDASLTKSPPVLQLKISRNEMCETSELSGLDGRIY